MATTGGPASGGERSQSLWQEARRSLPSLRRLVERLADDLAGGGSAVALLPPGVPESQLWRWLEELLAGRGRRLVVVPTARVPAPPATPLELARGLPGAQGATLEELLASPGCPVAVLAGLGRLAPEPRARWLRLLEAWARETRAVRAPLGLCVTDPAGALLGELPPEGVVGLRRQWWWGLPSALEARLLARELLLPTMADAAEADWLESLAAGVGAGDLPLVGAICEQRPDSLEALNELLRGYRPAPAAGAGRTRWGVPLQLDALAVTSPEAPPREHWLAWCEGKVVGCPEHGVEAHPWLLAHVAAGGDESAAVARVALERRVWRGQALSLMARADQIGLAAASFIASREGRGWFLPPNPQPDDPHVAQRLQECPLDADLGYVYYFLRAKLREAAGPPGVAGSGNGYRHWRELLQSVYDSRGKLAHSQPVDLEAVRRVLSTADWALSAERWG